MAHCPGNLHKQYVSALAALRIRYDVELATGHERFTYFVQVTNYAIALRAMHNFTIDNNRPDGEAVMQR
jgi:hypothetical protein